MDGQTEGGLPGVARGRREARAARGAWAVAAAALLLTLSLTLGARRGAPEGAGAVHAQAQAPAQESTPITEPSPVPRPVYLPQLQQRYDPLLPGPIDDERIGWIATLNRAGREACSPATHALLSRPEGSQGAVTQAVLRAADRPGAPRLDFYVGEYVRARGTFDRLPDERCIITRVLMNVEEIAILELPPP